MLLTRLKNILDEFGTANGLLYILGQALQRLTHGRAFLVRYHFFAQPVPSSRSPTCAHRLNPAFVKRRPATPLLPAFPALMKSLRNALQVAQGALLLSRRAASQDLYGWPGVSMKRTRFDAVTSLFLQIPVHGISTCYVVPTYRNGRTFARLWDAANALLAKEGINWSLSRISAFNVTSLAAHQRLGIKQICSAVFLRIGALQISIAPKKIALHLTGRPTLKLLAPRA